MAHVLRVTSYAQHGPKQLKYEYEIYSRVRWSEETGACCGCTSKPCATRMHLQLCHVNLTCSTNTQQGRLRPCLLPCSLSVERKAGATVGWCYC